jgi:L-alanine-DL-glutamate epimerase-like enolase superfamily enzyme
VPRPQHGELVLPNAPGLGLKFAEDAIARYGVA